VDLATIWQADKEDSKVLNMLSWVDFEFFVDNTNTTTGAQ